VTEEQLLDIAEKERAIPFDATRFPEVKLNHRGERCTFEAILEDYKLTEPALHRLGRIVRGADVKGQEEIAPESLGLRAIAQGSRYLGSVTRSAWSGSSRSTTRYTNSFATSRTER